MDSEYDDSLLERLNRGEQDVYDDVFKTYYSKLIGLARRRLAVAPPQVADEEGAVISAFRSFFSGIENHDFDQIEDRHELWNILVTITVRKAIKQLRLHFKKSGEGNQIDRSANLDTIRNAEPTPERVVELLDQCEFLVAQLDNPTLRQIAVLRLQGLDTREIADVVDLHRRSVQRKLTLIQSKWSLVGQD